MQYEGHAAVRFISVDQVSSAGDTYGDRFEYIGAVGMCRTLLITDIYDYI